MRFKKYLNDETVTSTVKDGIDGDSVTDKRPMNKKKLKMKKKLKKNNGKECDFKPKGTKNEI